MTWRLPGTQSDAQYWVVGDDVESDGVGGVAAGDGRGLSVGTCFRVLCRLVRLAEFIDGGLVNGGTSGVLSELTLETEDW